MIIFRNNNHLGDCLLQLGLLRALHKQHKQEIGFIVNGPLQHTAICKTEFLRHDFYPQSGVIDFKADDLARLRGLSLIEMWAESIPYKLRGPLRPFIQLTKDDYREARRLKLKGGVFVAPFKVTGLDEAIFEGQRYLKSELAGKGYFLLGEKDDPKWE